MLPVWPCTFRVSCAGRAESFVTHSGSGIQAFRSKPILLPGGVERLGEVFDG